MSFLYHTFFFDPLYNILVFAFNILPWIDAGAIVILLTILVRLIIFPLSKKAVNPFSGILIIIIQIPIILSLYQIFLHFPEVNSSLLYSFVAIPEHINTTFLGFLDITAKSIPLAVFAAVSTFFQFKFSMKGQDKPKGNSFGDNLARSMQTQMKYFFPVIVFFISYNISGVIALYWLTTNLFTIAQELFIRRKLKTTEV